MTEHISSLFLAALPFTLLSAGWYSGRKSTKVNQKFLQLVNGTLVALLAIAILTSLISTQTQSPISFVQTSPLRFIMLALVVVISISVTKFSLNYMAGDPFIQTYWRWLFNVLSAVTLVMISNHLLIFWLGWVCISLALHHLLTLYPDRPRALLAAHKKFLLARIAETLFLVAILLLFWSHNTFYISELVAHFKLVGQSDTLSLTVVDQIAAVLISLTALIKCAQLPVHGWLIQVVETPTPVSALLHAGVINLGGFLLILFAPLFMQVPIAQWLVLIVAGLSTVISALIMTTRISLKVNLAWSTSAQMGLMLLECALGLFELALLHLVAHSAYKAHAFLNSGSAVHEYLQQRLANQNHNPALAGWFFAALLSSGVIITTKSLVNDTGVWSLWFLMGLALTSLLAQRHYQPINFKKLRFSSLTTAPSLVLATLVLLSYLVLKWIFSLALPAYDWMTLAPMSWPDIWVMFMFASLFSVFFILRSMPSHPRVQFISRMLFAGLYLDEWLTRSLLRVWPLHYSIHVMGTIKSNNKA